MSIEIHEIEEPSQVSTRSRQLFQDAVTAEFRQLGWLSVELAAGKLNVAGFTNGDGGIALAFSTPSDAPEFDPVTVDMFSHLDENRKLTTTTFWLINPDEDKGIFKYSHPSASIAILLRWHRKYLKDLNGKVTVQVNTLKDLQLSIEDYLKFEAEAPFRPQQKNLMKNLRETGSPLVIRTDFSNQGIWEKICAVIRKPVEEFLADVEFVDDAKYSHASKEQPLKLSAKDCPGSFFIIVDHKAITQKDHPLLVVDLLEERGREFRAIPSEIAAIENNLSLSNMDFETFAEAAGKDGVFRGFPED